MNISDKHHVGIQLAGRPYDHSGDFRIALPCTVMGFRHRPNPYPAARRLQLGNSWIVDRSARIPADHRDVPAGQQEGLRLTPRGHAGTVLETDIVNQCDAKASAMRELVPKPGAARVPRRDTFKDQPARAGRDDDIIRKCRITLQNDQIGWKVLMRLQNINTIGSTGIEHGRYLRALSVRAEPACGADAHAGIVQLFQFTIIEAAGQAACMRQRSKERRASRARERDLVGEIQRWRAAQTELVADATEAYRQRESTAFADRSGQKLQDVTLHFGNSGATALRNLTSMLST